MSLRVDMLRAAAQAPRCRPEAAARAVRFLRAAMLPDGGFPDRSGRSDLYYTVFGMQGLAAVGDSPASSPTEDYLRTFGDGVTLDLVHVACLARCWALAAREGPPPDVRRAILARLQTHRSADGGFHPAPGAAAGTAYAAMLALATYQDLNASLPRPTGLVQSVRSLRSADGGYANEPRAARGATPATAAAITVLAELSEEIPLSATAWLLALAHPEGGFRAMPAVPVPDLLSTATALHALARAEMPLGRLQAPCLEFVEDLQADDGGFRGHWADETSDGEYTFYGLLALGHLAEEP